MTGRDLEAGPELDRLHSVNRALAMLEALASRREGASPKELGQHLGIHLSTCYRLLNTLAAAGYITRDAGTGLFRLGARIAYLHQGYLAALQAPAEALPFVHALQLATGETVMLGQLEGDDAVCTAVVAGSRDGAFPPAYIGMAIPAHAVAVGRVLLADLPAARSDAYITRFAARRNSPFPLKRPAALRLELTEIRQTGYAIDRGEGHPGVCCVAAPLGGGESENVTAISLLAPCGRFRDEESAVVTLVLGVSRAFREWQTSARLHPGVADGAHPRETVSPAAIAAVLGSIANVMSRVG